MVCDTSLIMDYEWFEPNTIWLGRPTWIKVSHIIIDIAHTNAQGEEHFDVEKAFNGGLADIDVCWNSRGDPCSEKTKSLKLQYLCFY